MLKSWNPLGLCRKASDSYSGQNGQTDIRRIRIATMDRSEEIREILDDLVSTLVREYNPERILLYGSYASGEPDEASDIDLFTVKESRERPTSERCESDASCETQSVGYQWDCWW